MALCESHVLKRPCANSNHEVKRGCRGSDLMVVYGPDLLGIAGLSQPDLHDYRRYPLRGSPKGPSWWEYTDRVASLFPAIVR